MYKIEYLMIDSEGTPTLKFGELEYIWSSIDYALETLHRIKTHYSLKKLGKSEDGPKWLINSKIEIPIEQEDSPFTVYKQITPIWVGYYESLIYIRIVEIEEDDLIYIPDKHDIVMV